MGIKYLADTGSSRRLKLSAGRPQTDTRPLQLNPAWRRGLRRADELDHVAVGVLDEYLPQARGPGNHVADGQAQLRDLARALIGVLGPEREVRVARQDLFPLDRRSHELVVEDDMQREPIAEAVPDAGKVEGRTRDLFEPEQARVEFPRLGDVGNSDAHVIQLLEQAHVDLLLACQLWQDLSRHARPQD